MSFNPYFPVHNYPYGSQPEFAPSWLLGEYNRLVTFINETLGAVVLPTASDITYNDGVTMLGETTVQGAIEKLKTLIDSFDVNASDVDFNNSGTSLASTNVQTAIIELLGRVENLPVINDASDVNFDNSGTTLISTNVQTAIVELLGIIGNIPVINDASDVSFDNSGTSMSSTNVQNAIIELLGNIGNIPVISDASDVSYDNSQTGMTADDVQEAIDELKDTIDNIPSGSGIEIVDVSAITPGTYSHADSENMPIMQKIIDAYTNNKALMIKDSGGILALMTNAETIGMGGVNLIGTFTSIDAEGTVQSYQVFVLQYANTETRYIDYNKLVPLRILTEDVLPTLIYPNSYSNEDITSDPDIEYFVTTYLMYTGEQYVARFKDANGNYWNIESVNVVSDDKTVKLATLAGGNIHILTFVIHNYQNYSTVTLDTSETTI